MSALVRCEVGAAELTLSGSVVAPLWLEVGDVAFPEAGWFDFPVPVLGWWIQALRSMVASTSDEALLRFMDGPFEVRVTGSGSQATVMLSSRGGTVDALGTTDPAVLLASATAAAVALVARLEGEGITSSPIADLKSLTQPGEPSADA